MDCSKSTATSESSVCFEPALILEEAAHEFEQEIMEYRRQQEQRLAKMLDQCWMEFEMENFAR